MRPSASLLIAVAACLAGLCACAPSLVEDAPFAGPFTTSQGRFLDGNGGELLLRGVNFSGSSKYPPFVPTEMDGDGRARLLAAGPMALRYVVTWAAIEPSDGVLDDAYLADIEARTRALADDGHLLVLDLHQDLFGVGFGGDGAPRFACAESAYASFVPRDPWFINYSAPQVQSCFDALFGDDAMLTHMARTLRAAVDAAQRGAGARLVGVDLVNEPHPGSSTAAAFDVRLARYYELAAEALDGSGVPLFFEPNVLHNLGEPTRLAAAPSSSAVYAPHLYPVDEELGRYSDFGAMARAVGVSAAEAEALGTPLVVGEYSPLFIDPGAVTFIDDVLAVLDSDNAGAFYWDWSPGADRGLTAPGAEDVAKHALRPHARRVAGHVTSQTFDPATGILDVSYDETGAVGATELVFPQAWGAPHVVAADGSVAIEGTLVRVLHDPTLPSHHVVVSAE